ncbi:hypothetical protein STRCI_001254 [Streptomyces cinnabarinus]|uniref:Uncharacterized protein n=1 Tax=Streptomyces cinnabarinus TaxID=67287 RepID=A0ABY7K8P0_9ACTN|nr:hypothetical protein [Streptomyces cinnabarinus]WAZ20155.1 hypothetical protein STRCI_001254 [Streptomyces cinnabarinus]
MVPTPGRIVMYGLSEDDARHITQQRAHHGVTGNFVREGDRYPAVVVRTFPGNPADVANPDGEDTHWANSRHEGDEPGTWAWPVRS